MDKNKYIVLIVGGILSLLLVAGFIIIKPNKGILSIIDYKETTININKNIRHDIHEERIYIYLPVNTEMNDVSASISIDGEIVDSENFINYLKTIDTFTPGELFYTYLVDDVEYILSIIIE